MSSLKPFIYADHAATTQLSDTAFEAMLPYLKEQYGNASTLYRLGRDAHKAIETARTQIARQLGAGSMEIYFTSGGSEADNWAVKGTLHRMAKKGKRHLVTSSIEHHAVLHSAVALEKEGVAVTYLPVDSQGRVQAEDVRAAIRPDTALVSIMYANNETGVLQPIRQIGAICREAGVLFHTDAVQAMGTLDINVKEQNIDLLSLSAHKFYGPKGAGALYCRKGTCPPNFVDGGEQERGHRAGTENVAAIVGMAAALEEACTGRAKWDAHLRALRDQIQTGLAQIPSSYVNGGNAERLPGTLNVSFEGIDGQSLIYELDLRGIAASSGSACNSGSISPSHVLLAMGLSYVQAHGALRISLGRYNNRQEAEQIIKAVTESVATLRRELSI